METEQGNRGLVPLNYLMLGTGETDNFSCPVENSSGYYNSATNATMCYDFTSADEKLRSYLSICSHLSCEDLCVRDSSHSFALRSVKAGEPLKVLKVEESGWVDVLTASGVQGLVPRTYFHFD